MTSVKYEGSVLCATKLTSTLGLPEYSEDTNRNIIKRIYGEISSHTKHRYLEATKLGCKKLDRIHQHAKYLQKYAMVVAQV